MDKILIPNGRRYRARRKKEKVFPTSSRAHFVAKLPESGQAWRRHAIKAARATSRTIIYLECARHSRLDIGQLLPRTQQKVRPILHRIAVAHDAEELNGGACSASRD